MQALAATAKSFYKSMNGIKAKKVRNSGESRKNSHLLVYLNQTIERTSSEINSDFLKNDRGVKEMNQ